MHRSELIQPTIKITRPDGSSFRLAVTKIPESWYPKLIQHGYLAQVEPTEPDALISAAAELLDAGRWRGAQKLLTAYSLQHRQARPVLSLLDTPYGKTWERCGVVRRAEQKANRNRASARFARGAA